MAFVDLFFVTVIALALTVLLIGAFGWRPASREPRWGGWLFVFFIFLFVIWLANVWVRPVGPQLFGVRWVPLLLVGLIVLLILAAAYPAPRRHVMEFGAETPPEGAVAVSVFTVFFWLLMILMIGLLVLGYLAGR